MIRLLTVTCLAVASFLAGPALAFDPSGELLFVARGAQSAGASYDADRLVGPTVNMSRREDGGWAGDLGGQNIDLEVSDTRLSGANVDLHVDRSNDKTTVRGTYFGQRISLELSPRTVSGRVGACSLDLTRKRPGYYEGDLGCVTRGTAMPAVAKATLKLAGDAATARPPMPQFALALISVLPG
ncbi:MAG TPA: hypothetical protein VF904_14835 [Anaeromyxobacteraceae bacterium]